MEGSVDTLLGQLGRGPLRPAYLVAGREPLLVMEGADAVRAAARRDGVAEREVFEAGAREKEPDWDALVASCNAPSLFASRRLLEVRLPTGKPGKAGGKVIEAFCAAPPPDVVLLVTAQDWSRQHGGAWSQALARVGTVAVAWEVKPHELPGWLDRRLRARGFSPDRDAVEYLAQRVEGNLLAAAQEVDKLELLLARGEAPRGGRPLTLGTLEALVADVARFDAFRLVDVALNGDLDAARRVLAGLRAEGEAVPALMGAVVGALSTGAALARTQAGGGNLAAAFKAHRVWDAKQPMYRRALQRHGVQQWDALLRHAGQVDRMSKGRAPGDAWQALERLMLALADRGGSRMLQAG